MSRWSRAQIRYVAHLGTGHTPSRSVEEYWNDCDIPWLTLADVGQLRTGVVDVVSSTNEMISELGVANSSAVVHPAGTVAMSRTASVGYSCILGADMATSQDYVTWTCGPRLFPKFLLWVLRGERETIIGRMQGSTHKTIYMPDIEQMSTPLPPLEKQKAIAAYLDAETAHIDALIAKKRRMIGLLEERELGLLDQVFGPTSGERLLRLARSARIQTGVTVNASRSATASDVTVPYLRVANVQQGSLDLEEVKTISLPQKAASDARLQPGDVLMTEGGDIDKLGRGTVWQGQIDNCVHQNHVFAVRVDLHRLDPDFLAHMTRTSHARSYFESTGVQSTNLASTNSTKVADFQFPLPGVTEQRRKCDQFEAERETITDMTTRLTLQVELLTERRQALITAAVTGELEIPGVAA